MPLTCGLLLCWLNCKSSSFVRLSAAVRADFHCSVFVLIFINSFSIGLTLWAERYKIPAQQQALSLVAIQPQFSNDLMQKSLVRFLLFLIVTIFFSCNDLHDNGIKYGGIYSDSYHDLMEAAKEQDLNKIEEIVTNKQLNLNYADSKEGISLLNWCLINNKIKSFEKLLQLGADPNWQDYRGIMAPPLIEAASNDDSNYLKLCLRYGGKPNLLSKKWQGFEQQTPLFGAVSAGVLYPRENLVNLKILINAGADVNLSRDSNSSSPLAEALIAKKIEMAKFLIDNGANYNNLKFRTSNIALDSNLQPIIDSEGSPTIKYGEVLNILHFLRQIDFPLNSTKYKTKMEIVNFLSSKGLGYWKSPIPQQVIDNHKRDTAFLSRY